jgi:hypothetical protein
MFFTDVSLSADILEALMKELEPLNKIYLKKNYPFLNSITFLSKKFNQPKIKILTHKDSSLNHFKNTLKTLLEELLQVILKSVYKNEKIIKMEVGLKSKNDSLYFLNELIQSDYIKSALSQLDNIENYYLLQNSLNYLSVKNGQGKNLFFQLNRISIFNGIENVQDTLKKIKLVLKSADVLTLTIREENLKIKKFIINIL